MRGFIAVTTDGKYIPDLATTVPTVENGGVVISGTTFDVKVDLKPDLKWSDGTPLTMDDYVATWKWATDKAQTGCIGCSTGWPDIGGIDESTDKLTATIHFKDLYAGWLGFLTRGPWPATYLDSVPVAKASSLYPISPDIAKVPFDGPFVITNASKTEIDYAPNPDWAGGVSTAHAPYLAGLKFVYYGDKNGEINDFLAGKLDLALGLNQADDPAIEKVDPTIGRAEEVPVWRYEHLDVDDDSRPHPRQRPVGSGRAEGTGHGHRQGEPHQRAVPRPEHPAGLLARPARPLVRRRRDLPGLRPGGRDRCAAGHWPGHGSSPVTSSTRARTWTCSCARSPARWN